MELHVRVRRERASLHHVGDENYHRIREFRVGRSESETPHMRCLFRSRKEEPSVVANRAARFGAQKGVCLTALFAVHFFSANSICFAAGWQICWKFFSMAELSLKVISRMLSVFAKKNFAMPECALKIIYRTLSFRQRLDY